MDNASVSIIAPVYGVEKYIHTFLDSIQKQTFQDIEIILVDDGSKDNCPAILDEFARNNKKCRVIHQKNSGVSAARNAGLDAARGKYVYIVDSDDWLEPDAIETLYNEAERTGADLVYGDWVRERPNPELIVSFPNEFYTENKKTLELLQCAANNNNKAYYSCEDFPYITHLGGAPWRCLMKRSIIEDNKVRFDPYVRGLWDDILFTLYLYEHVSSVAYIHKVLYHWRVVENSYTHGYKPNFIETIRRIFEHMEEYLRRCNKGKMHWKAYYIRVMLYFDQALAVYFMNVMNEKSDKERYAEFRDFVHSHPVCDAVRHMPLGVIEYRPIKVASVMLRLGLVRPYWEMKKRRMKNQ